MKNRKVVAAMVLIWMTTLFASGCLKLRQPPTPPEPEYMDTTDRYDILDVETVKQAPPPFILNGKPICFAGTNNYYLIYKGKKMVDDVLDKAVELNLKVIRIWGNIDRGTLDGSIGNADLKPPGDGTKDGVYFQYFDKEAGKPRYNDGPDGLQRLDYVLHGARKRGLKLLISFTNNWREFGGMDQYLMWYGIEKHHEFYTDPRVRQAYKAYVEHLVNRKNSIDGTVYKDDPAIFAWELANEPRCMNGEEFDSQEGWDTNTIVNWASEMSLYIKSIDHNHMVAVGDEGFLNAHEDHWAYRAQDGVDHEALCAIDNIDFCIFHLYPDDWGTGYKFGYDWIMRHLKIALKLGKPTMLEEYGTIIQRNKETMMPEWGWKRRVTAYNNWLNIFRKQGGTAALFWMLGGYDDENGTYPDYDHYTVYKDMPTSDLLKKHTDAFANKAPSCSLADTEELKNLTAIPFVSTAKLLKKIRPSSASE